MVLELQEDNSIFAYAANAEENGEPIFYMPAPFLVDDNLAYNDDITVSLQKYGDTYTLTYSLPRAWLLEEERAYPVVLDPIIEPDRGRFDIEDQTVFSKGSMSYTWGCVATGYSKNLGKARTLIRFTEIPELTSADVIVGANISFYLLETNATTTPKSIAGSFSFIPPAKLTYASFPASIIPALFSNTAINKLTLL